MKDMIRTELSGNTTCKPAILYARILRMKLAAPQPSLSQVQYFVRKIRKELYGNVNDLRVARVLAEEMKWKEGSDPTEAFAFGNCAFNEAGDVIIGDGSDQFPFRIGKKFMCAYSRSFANKELYINRVHLEICHAYAS
jgi:hypothetical protein